VSGSPPKVARTMKPPGRLRSPLAKENLIRELASRDAQTGSKEWLEL